MSDPAFSTDIQAIMDAYAALNRGDVEGFIASFDPQIERIEPSDFPGGGVYHGIDAVREHVRFHRSNWAEGACEPQRFVVSGDKVVVISNVHVKLKNETGWRDGRVGDVFTFKNGKVIQFRTFFSENDAMAFAGLKVS